jgi:hypothetical protein
MAISLNDLKLDDNGFLMSEKPLSTPEWNILEAQLFTEWQNQKKIISSTPTLPDSLLAFLKWYRKQILAKGCNEEAVIELYLAPTNPTT